MCCFFFKQKTAYEMRISDWSSDVCSSDLDCLWPAGAHRRSCRSGGPDVRLHPRKSRARHGYWPQERRSAPWRPRCPSAGRRRGAAGRPGDRDDGVWHPALRFRGVQRSEEHTSELQSLMRISYAVFCLKKKKKITQRMPTLYSIQTNETI